MAAGVAAVVLVAEPAVDAVEDVDDAAAVAPEEAAAGAAALGASASVFTLVWSEVISPYTAVISACRVASVP